MIACASIFRGSYQACQSEGSSNLSVHKILSMDALRIWEFSLNQTIICQTVVFLLKKINSFLFISINSVLREVILLHQITDSGEKSEKLINIHTATAKRVNTVLKIVIAFMAQP